MVTPVNSDKPITPGSARTNLSRDEKTHSQVTGRGSEPITQSTAGTELKPDVDDARQLYQLENNSLENVRSGLQTSEQARSLLDQLLQQISTAPEAAMKSHVNGSNGLLGSLLTAAPT